MRLRTSVFFLLLGLFVSIPSLATVLSSLHGIVHDPQHAPIQGAQITLQSPDSAFQVSAVTNRNGSFDLERIPLGTYRISVQAKGFATTEDTLTLLSGTNPILHYALAVAATNTTVSVAATQDAIDTVTPTTLISRKDIDETPGAGRTIGTELITDYVPGAYMTHDMLHMRGGHQTSWLLDGIAIPNTKIASNVGPQIDPKDIEQLQVDRGSYASDIGDRTYGVFNVLPRNGFERSRDAELVFTAGNFYTGETQLSFGDHSEKTAYYASLTGTRSDYGLAPPVAGVYHDATNSQSGFLSVLHNQTPKDQLRFDGQFREDYFQVPYDPDPNDWESQSGYYPSLKLRDAQTERDGFVLADWVHTLSPKALFEIAPFYHLNQANYDSLPSDLPVATTWHQSSNYFGAQADFHDTLGPNSFSGGLYGFFQSENDTYGVLVKDGSARSQPNSAATDHAGLFEAHFSDHLQVNRWIALLGGMRYSNYHADLNETAFYPRIGATVELPKLHWVFRGFYGHFFQPAPLITFSASAKNYAGAQSSTSENGFAPVPSERDEEHQFGVAIPYKGWVLDIDTFKNRVNNFLDHSNLGESNIYFPIADQGALVRAWELTLRSPQLLHFGQFHLAYSNQIAEQRGNIIGGLICNNGNPANPILGTVCDQGPQYEAVDHDQRNTLNTGFTANLPMARLGRTWFSSNVYYGSGFSNGVAGLTNAEGNLVSPYQGPYLPVHTTFDVSAGHSLGERLSLTASVLNVTNHRVLEDTSITIGGFHYNDPRLISASLKYRFHF